MYKRIFASIVSVVILSFIFASLMSVHAQRAPVRNTSVIVEQGNEPTEPNPTVAPDEANTGGARAHWNEDGDPIDTGSASPEVGIGLEQPEEPIINLCPYGDVNGNGEVDGNDAYLVVVSLTRHNLTAAQIQQADVDGDGQVTYADYSLIMRFVYGQINHFPVCW